MSPLPTFFTSSMAQEQLFAKALGSLATDSPEAERGTAAPHFDADFEATGGRGGSACRVRSVFSCG